ncbi:MAG: 3-isopropylmalate dehydratase large subunit [Muribaculaceae bacterium]|nr:3-isopropylmalate dehydratase large subunit [Muribaculaceae bacterium]
MSEPKTLFDKVWDGHVVTRVADGPDQLYIDRHYCHEVTSPQAFAGLRERGLKVFRPERTFCSPDHNIPTHDQDCPIADPVSRHAVETLEANAAANGLAYYGLGDELNGIIHVIGPEQGLSLPGYTIVCGDSHTSTHGAVGAVAFGIGTSEVEMVLATQCILQPKPKSMRITVNGSLQPGVTAKDVALYLIARLGTDGCTGYFVEYAGEAIRSLSMEGRMTLCNMSIEMGARGGMVGPDATTVDYLRGRLHVPDGDAFDRAADRWLSLATDEGASFDREECFDAADIGVRVTYGTNPGMGIAIDGLIPEPANETEAKALDYMGFKAGEPIAGTPVDYVFVGSCTNGRIEDFREFARVVKGRHRHDSVTAWLVPGSRAVLKQIEAEGLDRVLADAGFELRQPGCSACLAMNDDRIPAGCLCVSTSNRNFEGRQGPDSRTVLASPATAAAAAITGRITNPNEL